MGKGHEAFGLKIDDIPVELTCNGVKIEHAIVILTNVAFTSEMRNPKPELGIRFVPSKCDMTGFIADEIADNVCYYKLEGTLKEINGNAPDEYFKAFVTEVDNKLDVINYITKREGYQPDSDFVTTKTHLVTTMEVSEKDCYNDYTKTMPIKVWTGKDGIVRIRKQSYGKGLVEILSNMPKSKTKRKQPSGKSSAEQIIGSARKY